MEILERLKTAISLGLFRAGVTRSRFLWPLLLARLPELAYRIAMVSELNRSANEFLWPYRGEDTGCEGLAEELDELINRAAAPAGLDEFKIILTALGSLPVEPDPGDLPALQASVERRAILDAEALWGDRYYDWKKGEAKEKLSLLLSQFTPRSDRSLTIIQVAVVGAAYDRIRRELQERTTATRSRKSAPLPFR